MYNQKNKICKTMLPDIIQNSYSYRNIVTHVVLKSLILVEMDIGGLLQIFSNFQKTSHIRAFPLIPESWIQGI